MNINVSFALINEQTFRSVFCLYMFSIEIRNKFSEYLVAGLACMTVMFITTFLMALVIIFVWQKSILIATIFLLFFWIIEGVSLSAAFLMGNSYI
jgi:K+ transporter